MCFTEPAVHTTHQSQPITIFPFILSMSSPNVSVSGRNGAGQQHSRPSFGTSKVIYVGKDRHPLTIQSLVPVSAPTFMKQAGFHSLVSTLRSQSAAYQSADLVAAISDELPINTASASNEASIVCESLYRAPFDINNLQPCAFFDDRGSRIMDTISFDPALRPPNMAFVNFSCTVRCSSIDSRIQQPDYSFNFSLKLPQTLQPPKPVSAPGLMSARKQAATKRKASKSVVTESEEQEEGDKDNKKGEVDEGNDGDEKEFASGKVDDAGDNLGNEEDYDPVAVQAFFESMRATGQDMDESVLQNAFKAFLTTLGTTGAGRSSKKQKTSMSHSGKEGLVINLQPQSQDSASMSSSIVPQGSSLDALASPKMSQLVSRGSKNSVSTVFTYCGPLNFADNQEMFNVVFGSNPVMLHVTKFTKLNDGPSSASGPASITDSASPAQQFHMFVQRCHFDIFVALCESDYVGIVNSHSTQKAIQEVCRKLQGLQQKFQTKNGKNQWVTLHPADLYNKYLSFVASLPPNASSWSIVLCKCFYDALLPELKEKMEESNFIMPDMTTLATKNNQLQALRTVREGAVAAYDNLQAEKKRIMSLVSPNQQYKQQHNVYYLSGEQEYDNQSLQQYADGNQQTQFANHRSGQFQPQESPFRNGNFSQESGPLNPVFRTSMSQAETTIQRHQPGQQMFGGATSAPSTPPQNSRTSIQSLPHRQGQDGRMYPFHPQEPSVLSDYPLGFRGCYGCGDPGHWRFRTECPLRDNADARKRFWKNLWIHRPHTKRRQDNIAQTSPSTSQTTTNNYYQNNNTHNSSSPQQQGNLGVYNTNGAIPSSPHHGPPSLPQFTHNGPAGSGLGRGRHVNIPSWLNPSQGNEFATSNTRNDSLPPLPPPPVTQSQHQQQQQGERRVRFQRDPEEASKQPLWVTSARILQHSSGIHSQPMPLDLDNGLPGIVFRVGNPTTTQETSFLCHLDTCAGMNTGKLSVHRCLATRFPHCVAEWRECTDQDSFDPIRLDCAVERQQEDQIDQSRGRLTHIVRYYTPHTYDSGKRVILSSGLGEDVSVNALIGLTDIKRWGGDLSFSRNVFEAFHLGMEWPLMFKSADSIYNPPNFDPNKDFVRPNSGRNSNGPVVTYDNLGVDKLVATKPSGYNLNKSVNSRVVDSYENGIFRRAVNLDHLEDE